MAGIGLFDYTSDNTYTLVEKESDKNIVGTVNICNGHASNAVKVDLFLDDELGNANSDTYIIKNVSIPSGATLRVTEVSFDSFKQALKIKILASSGTPEVSVII